MTTRKMRVDDWSMQRRKRAAVPAWRLEREIVVPPTGPGNHMVQGINDNGRLEYTKPKPGAPVQGWSCDVAFRGAGPCTIAHGTGVTAARHPAKQMGGIIASYVRQKLGYGDGSLAWIIFTEADAAQSGDKGHHNYQASPMGGSKMADFCDKWGERFGVWYRSPPRGRYTTGTATPLRVLAYSPPSIGDAARLYQWVEAELARGLPDEDERELRDFLTGHGAPKDAW